ncbi:hypothetical protein ET495_08735 [Xylanimonas allomyrinae]|uniref:Energy-coupling factor transporter transmembrane protein EcfT n=1 Tax=Xylanimonas allomyrinae TaxID=2509459 RepID=A0A4P6EPL7_9MICO|nr:CbiQ family ECF transporter T component [Xylanimonas allomyrinae]QAY63319.1 hypothetical protein ET495_08735 [Xylanimonas allomyrinae]
MTAARSIGRRLPAAASLLLLAACSATPASSPSPAGPPSGDDDVAACTDAGDVWLVVAAEDGTRLADQCVGTPATGTAALDAAGLDVARDASGFICAVGGEPAQCPAAFDGRFWQYYTATPGGEWAFATAGSDEAVPAPGTIEGWCYGSACTPPEIADVTAPPPRADEVGAARPGRELHPGAWWAWAAGAAAAVSLTTHALLAALVAAAAGAVALRRRPADGARRTWWLYVSLGAAIVVVRLVLQAVLGVNRAGTVLFTLPRVPLPTWAAGIRLGGPVTVDGMALALGDGLRLAVIVMCVGAAAVLASPRRALRALPAALGEATTAMAIALTVAPQLLDSAARVRRARRLRGSTPGRARLLRSLVLPVLGDAIDRSVSIAAAMEARGYGATLDARRVPAATAGLTAAALGLLGFGAVAVLGLPGAGAAGTACLVAGGVCSAAAMTLARRRLAVTRYRPTPWTRRESAVAASGTATFAVAAWALATDPAVMRPTSPALWPAPTPAMLAVPLLVACALAWTAAPAQEAR